MKSRQMFIAGRTKALSKKPLLAYSRSGIFDKSRITRRAKLGFSRGRYKSRDFNIELTLAKTASCCFSGFETMNRIV